MAVRSLALPSYPGRGVLVGRDRDGRRFWIYFVTGRSESSLQRELRSSSHQLHIVPRDVNSEHDRLRHYVCVDQRDGWIVVGNGDHVEELAISVSAGVELREAFAQVESEPDPPIHTPRIAALLDGTTTWLCTAARAPSGIRRSVTPVDIEPGTGWVVHTYGGTRENVFAAACPHEVRGISSLNETADRLWDELDVDLRVLVAGGRMSVEPERTHNRQP